MILDTESFFDESSEQSRIKADNGTGTTSGRGQRSYFPPSRKQGGRIAYIDLFAGKGRYNDGTKSTPLLVLEERDS